MTSRVSPLDDLDGAVEALAACRAPLLIGVRHHSPVCAAAIPAILDAFEPDRVLIELPEELEPWLGWLCHPEARAPMALSAAWPAGDLSFHPFADFSPELAAARWAAARGVPLAAIDLPLALRGEDRGEVEGAEVGEVGVLEALLGRVGARDVEQLWERLVEVPGVGQPPEAVRRAGLMVGWAMRVDAHLRCGVSRLDLAREGHMRARIAQAEGRSAAVVGAFHAAALLPSPLLWRPVAPVARGGEPPETSIIPYSQDLFDARSGYPAGILDPEWRQRVWEAARDGEPMEAVVAEVAVRICAQVRAQRHVASMLDATEVARLSVDLARLRGLSAPGRGELLEALGAALGQGAVEGRARVLERACAQVLVGQRRGVLAPGTPRCGLEVHVERLLVELKLPGPGAASGDLRLDPMRKPLDRRRHVALSRLRACGVHYSVLQETAGLGDGEALTTRWTAAWTPATGASLALMGVMGATLEQASAGALRRGLRRAMKDERPASEAALRFVEEAAECGLVGLVQEGVSLLRGSFLAQATLGALVSALSIVERVRRGHVPAMVDVPIGAWCSEPEGLEAELAVAAVSALEGLAGSEDPGDALAVLDLVEALDQRAGGLQIGDGRLLWALRGFERQGSPLMQGAGLGALVRLGDRPGVDLGGEMGGWLDAAVDAEGRRALTSRFEGVLTVCGAIFEGEPGWLQGLVERVGALPDEAFLERLPALRQGFEARSPASRRRLLVALAPELGDHEARRVDEDLEVPALVLAAWARADREAASMAAARFLRASVRGSEVEADHGDASAGGALGASGSGEGGSAEGGGPTSRVACAGDIGLMDRWRLMLGQERDKLAGRCARASSALEGFFGRGRGEGSRTEGRGGQEVEIPSTRDWAEELGELFGGRVREEVLGRALEAGRRGAALELDPSSIVPSVALLEQALALRGSLSEDQMSPLRRLIERVVEGLVKALAARLEPALSGLVSSRPSRRPTGRLDLRRTVSANLKTAWRGEGGEVRLRPERLIFRARSRRALDWRLILVVDVSGSMEASVIYSAVVAAILSRLPALSVHFLAFNTEVIDFTARVDDPLELLLGVRIGGGTHIAQALRHAAGLMTVPSRTMVVAVTDFEEGPPIGGLVSAVEGLVEAGARALGVAALDDAGAPRYSRAVAERVVAAGMPVAALSPLELARWVGDTLRGGRS